MLAQHSREWCRKCEDRGVVTAPIDLLLLVLLVQVASAGQDELRMRVWALLKLR